MDTERGTQKQAAAFAPNTLGRGILWNTAGQVAARILNLLFILLLARLIAPREFGLVAVGTAFIGFVSVITDIGVGAALVQRQDSVPENASAAFYMNALMIASFTSILLLMSEPIARYFEQPALRRLLPLLTAAFLIRGLMAVHEAYLRKNLRFRRVQVINIASVLAYGLVAVILASWGAEAWSLAWGLLAGSCVYAGLIVVGSGMPLTLGPHFRFWRDLFRFGRWVFLAGVVTWVLQAGDNLAVGKVLGPADLGAYAIAYSYGLLPFMLIGGAIAQAMFPAYSRLQAEPNQLHPLLKKIIRMTAAVSFPLAGVFFFVASDVLVALLGSRWTEAGPPFGVFAVVFTLGMFTASFPRVYDALNRPIVNLYISLAALPVLVGGVAIGLRWGVLGVALGVSAMAIELLILQVFAVARITGIPSRSIVASVRPPALCLALGVAAGLLPFGLLRGELPNLAVDIVAAAITLLVYSVALRRFFFERWSEIALQCRKMLVSSRSAG